jgi:hypothetical protein
MKVKYGAIITEGRGKINGFVASRNRGGAYLRTKVTPVNPGTSFQSTVRSRLATNAQAWKGLTAAQRAAWNASVKDFAKTDIFGDLKNPSGFNLYCSLNNNLANAGQSLLTDPPVPAAVVNLTGLVLTAAKGTPALSLAADDDVDAGSTILVFGTPALSPGKSFAKPFYRQFSTLAASATTPFNLLTDYQAKFGTIGSAGLKIFIKVIAINNTTGQASPVLETSAIIAA